FVVARPEISEEVVSPTRSRFMIEPLEPGFGYTVGNSLRRVLYSSIPGAAISSVRIEGVLHEFSTIPNVTEDVTDIILKLKELVNPFSELAEAASVTVGPAEDDSAPSDYSITIEELNLSVRSYNCLKRVGINSVGELVTKSEAELMDIRNFGQKSIDEVK